MNATTQTKPTKYMGRSILPTSSVDAKGKVYIAREHQGMMLDESLCEQYPSVKAAKEAIRYAKLGLGYVA